MDPGYGRRNYFECPTCKYSYRLERMKWSKWIGSTATQIFLTLLILWTTVFVLGFVADPILNLYIDPVGTLTDPLTSLREPALILEDEEEWTWIEHILKGLASLGLLGFVKVVLASSPWHWYNMRNVVRGGGRAGRANGGRERLENISWHLVLIGVVTFLWAVWKGVRAWSRRTLEKAGEKVVDVHGDEDDDEEEEDIPRTDTAEDASERKTQ